MIDDDNDDQMIYGDLGGLKLPDICLTGEEKPQKNLTQETCPDWGSNPGPLHDRRTCNRLAHSSRQPVEKRHMPPNKFSGNCKEKIYILWIHDLQQEFLKLLYKLNELY